MAFRTGLGTNPMPNVATTQVRQLPLSRKLDGWEFSNDRPSALQKDIRGR